MKGDDVIINIYEFVESTKKFEKKTNEELIERLKELNIKLEKDERFSDEEYTDRLCIQDELASRLGMVSQNMLQTWQEDVMEKIADQVNKVEARLRNHRHDTSKVYGGKAEF